MRAGTRAGEFPRVLVLLAAARHRGAEIQGTQLRETLRSHGLEVSIAALQLGSDEHPMDVPVLPGSSRSWRSMRELRGLAQDHDVVIAYGSTTLPACAIALLGSGVPFIYRSIGDPAEWVRGRLHRERTRGLFRRAAMVVPLFERSAISIQRLYGVPNERIAVIPNARDQARYPLVSPALRAAARAELGIVDHVAVVAVVGSLSPEKDVGKAIETMAHLPSAHLLVVGDGPERGRLERHAESVAPDRIRFLGQLDSAVPVFHAADVLLVTSKTEGMPGVVIEAALCGIPAVTTDVGAVRELIVDGVTGVVVKTNEPETLAAATATVLDDRSDLGNAARSHVMERFTWDSMVPKWTQVIEAASVGRHIEPSRSSKVNEDDSPSM